jgi:hypothetical protein
MDLLRSRPDCAALAALCIVVSRKPQKSVIPVIEGLVLGRKLIWFHHILNTAKRKAIVSWSAELEIGGFIKPGYPGVVIIEGVCLWPDDQHTWSAA